MTLKDIIHNAILEDTAHPLGFIPVGDHSANSCIPPNDQKRAKLILKDTGILAGIEVAVEVFSQIDPKLKVDVLMRDGQSFKPGDIGFTVEGNTRSILLAERLVLNTMQRMSGIATKTRTFVDKIAHTNCRVLDTRKTTPNFRILEKMAVKIGGGENHRFGLYDMIMLKDNHIDYCGGIENAVKRALEYKEKHKLSIPIEVETRNLRDVEISLHTKGIDRIMLDNFSPEDCAKAVELVKDKIPLEASGGINLDTIVSYAETGVNFISVGSLTYSYKSLDMSLKAY